MGGYYSTTIGNAYGKIVDGTTTISSSGTAVQITATSTPIGGVWLAADLGNTSPLVVGTSTVVAASASMRGIILTPGNPSVFVPVGNLNLLWVDAQTSGDKLVWAYLQPTTGSA